MRPWYLRLLATAGILLVLGPLLAGSGLRTAGAGSLYGGSVRTYAFTGVSQNFNPFLPFAMSGTQGLIYETLLVFHQLEGGKITPWLATGYHFSSDAASVSFTLRSGVNWSDGQPFTSADVAFTLNLLKRYPTLDTAGMWQVITSVSAPDAQTVVVHFKQPSAQLLWYLAGQTFIVPEHLWKNVADPTAEDAARPVGTGPFMLKSFRQGVQYVLARNPRYWQPGKPYIDQISYSLVFGDVAYPVGPPPFDWLGIFSSNIQQSWVSLDPQHTHYWFPSTSVNMLYLNLTKAPFNQVAVRQAISAAIDRAALSTQAEDGYEPVASPTALALPANQPFLDPKYQHTTFPAANAARAASILEAAGFRKGSDGVYADASGQKLAFTLNMDNAWGDWMSASQIIAQNLNAAGMQVAVNAESYQDYLASLTGGTFDAAIAWTATGPTPYYLYQSLLASNTVAPAGSTAASNWERWSDPETDRLLKQYASTPDPPVQRQALFGLEQIMVEQMPAIPLFNQVNWYEYTTAHFVGWPDARNPYALPAPYSYPDEEIVALTIHKV